jgi:hypothetical protein
MITPVTNSSFFGDAGEVSVGDQRLVKRIAFFIRAGQFRFSAGMLGAEDMIVDHNMVVTQVFGRLGKRLDRPGIAAKFDLRVNHTSFHRPLPLSRCEVLRQIQTVRVRSGPAAQPPAHNFCGDRVADYAAR